MRILHELNQLSYGGAERIVLGIAKWDKTNKHIVYSYKDGSMKSLFEKHGIEVVVDDKKTEHNLEIDLIHLHTGGSDSVMANSVQGQIPTVETVHSPCVSGVRDEYVTKRIGVSNVVTNKNRKCETIYNGVDVHRLENDLKKADVKKAFGIPEDAFVVGRLGRVGYDKCLEEFIVACWKFQKQYNDGGNIYILICGGEAKNAKGYLAKIKVACASLPLKNVKFVEETEDVVKCYEAMDVFLYPSPTEGFGLVYMEAMACEVPVITWNNDLTSELLMGHATLTKPTIQSLSNSLKSFYEDPDRGRELGALGQGLVLSEFTEQIMSENYQKMYASLDIKEKELVTA